MLAMAWAEVPMPRQGIVTFVSISMLIRLGYAIINRKRSADLRIRSVAVGFPLDRYMCLVLTEERLIIWGASRYPRRRKEIMGDISTDAIGSATMPYASTGPMRTIALMMRNGQRVQFRTDRVMADALVDLALLKGS